MEYQGENGLVRTDNPANLLNTNLVRETFDEIRPLISTEDSHDWVTLPSNITIDSVEVDYPLHSNHDVFNFHPMTTTADLAPTLRWSAREVGTTGPHMDLGPVTTWAASDGTTSTATPPSWALTATSIEYELGINGEYNAVVHGIGIYAPAKPTPIELMRDIIRERKRLPSIIIAGRNCPTNQTRRKRLSHPVDEREQRARETLKRIIGDKRYRDYLNKGFVTLRNPRSGKVYQIFPSHGMTCVYEDGTMIEKLCVVLPHDFAPTDSVVVRYLLAVNDEPKLWELSVKWGGSPKSFTSKTLGLDMRPLPDIYRELKLQAA